jgi:lysophospholipase L1-like esterase
MDRRSALALLATGVLGGCGGGGAASPAPSDVAAGAQGSTVVPGTTAAPAQTASTASPAPSSPAPAASPSPTPTVAAALTTSIACWGDSITDLYARVLPSSYPARQVFNGGVVGQTSTQIADRETADSSHKTWISIFWYGHNDGDKSVVKADLARSIAALAPGNKAFVVLSMLPWAGRTQENSEMMAVNAELAALYPDNYLDIHEYLVGLYNPLDAQDVQDHANDLTPSSLRFDTIHLNDAGCNAVCGRLKEFLAAKGW